MAARQAACSERCCQGIGQLAWPSSAQAAQWREISSVMKLAQAVLFVASSKSAKVGRGWAGASPGVGSRCWPATRCRVAAASAKGWSARPRKGFTATKSLRGQRGATRSRARASRSSRAKRPRVMSGITGLPWGDQAVEQGVDVEALAQVMVQRPQARPRRGAAAAGVQHQQRREAAQRQDRDQRRQPAALRQGHRDEQSRGSALQGEPGDAGRHGEAPGAQRHPAAAAGRQHRRQPHHQHRAQQHGANVGNWACRPAHARRPSR
jgi:hypothetical protein